ncbi:MAG: disulfide bond formation protein DsbD, partial [Ekhidna sp.]
MKKLFLSFVFATMVLGAFSQVLKPISWKVELSEVQPNVGDEIEIRFKAKIEKDWYLYSTDFDPDLGPMVTEFNFETNDTYE